MGYYYGSYFTAELKDCIKIAERTFRKDKQRSKLCGLIFAHPESKFAQNNILPMINYWNFRSKNHIDFYFLGYLGDPNISDSEFSPNIPREFNDEIFIEAIEEIENNTTWQYNGNPTMPLCRTMIIDFEYGKFDFKKIVEFDFTKTEKEDIYDSVNSLFEELIRASKDSKFKEVDFDLVQTLYSDGIAKSVIETILDNLPLKLGRLFKLGESIRVIKS